MKQVTMESVKQRIAEASELRHRDGRDVVAERIYEQVVKPLQEQIRLLNEQRDALVAEAAALKSGDLFFSYGSEHGFEWHKTAKEAAENAEAAIDDYRGDACDGWPEEVSSICWGVIMQSSTMVGERPRNEDDCVDSAIDTICDYALLPAIETSATSSAIAALRAEGVEMFAKKCSEKSKQAISSDTRDNWWLCGENADDFARQLRESKGANHE